jgi:hypothetical protein
MTEPMQNSAPAESTGGGSGEGDLAKAKRRIGVVTTSRADYSHLYWPL